MALSGAFWRLFGRASSPISNLLNGLGKSTPETAPSRERHLKMARRRQPRRLIKGAGHGIDGAARKRGSGENVQRRREVSPVRSIARDQCSLRRWHEDGEDCSPTARAIFESPRRMQSSEDCAKHGEDCRLAASAVFEDCSKIAKIADSARVPLMCILRNGHPCNPSIWYHRAGRQNQVVPDVTRYLPEPATNMAGFIGGILRAVRGKSVPVDSSDCLFRWS
jgi:hypothetical protein